MDIPVYNEEMEILYMEDGVYKVMNKEEAYDRGFLVRPGEEPPPIDLTPPPQVVLAALAEVCIENDELTTVGNAVNFGGGMILAPGIVWIFFAEAQTDVNYVPTVQSSGYNVDVTYPLNETYIEVTVTDRVSGEPSTPSRITLDVKRVQ